MLSTAFLWHNYGHSTIGARADLENVPIDRLQAFYRKYYQPDNAVPARRGQVRRDRRRSRSISQHLRRDPEADARAAAHLHGRARRRMASGASSCGASATSSSSPSRTTSPPAAHPDAAAVALLDEVLGADARGPPVQGARRDEEGLVGRRRSSCSLHDPGVPRCSSAEVRQESPLADAETTMLADDRRDRRSSRSRRRKSTARARRPQEHRAHAQLRRSASG